MVLGHYWELIGHNISTAVLSFLNAGRMAVVVNITILMLIPKVKKPTSQDVNGPLCRRLQRGHPHHLHAKLPYSAGARHRLT
jgi:hypothetical protein